MTDTPEESPVTGSRDKPGKWCHEAHFFKYANRERDNCNECNGDKRRPLNPADEHCVRCRLPCGKDCAPDTGPCCQYCHIFYPEVGPDGYTEVRL